LGYSVFATGRTDPYRKRQRQRKKIHKPGKSFKIFLNLNDGDSDDDDDDEIMTDCVSWVAPLICWPNQKKADSVGFFLVGFYTVY